MVAIVTGLFGVITGHLSAKWYLRRHARPHWPSFLAMLTVLGAAVFAGSYVVVWFIHAMMIG